MSPLVDLTDHVVVIAGAGGNGIGTACAVMAARAGARVIAIDRSSQGRDQVGAALAETGVNWRVVDCDLFNPVDVATTFADIATRDGPIRGLVNVVGGILGGFSPLLDDIDGTNFRRILGNNLNAAHACSTAAARSMLDHGRGGSIVQIASATGLVSMAYGGGYGAAKAALLNLTRTMAVEWGGFGVRVNAIAVGMIRTERSHDVVRKTDEAARMAVPLARVGTSEEIAGPAMFLLSDLASYISGATLNVDGGSMARAPYNDEENLPVFVNDPDVRADLRHAIAELRGDSK